MTKVISSLLALSTGTFLFIGVFEDQLKIVPRYEANTIQADVARVQSVNGVLDQLRFARNMQAVESHVKVVKSLAR